MTTNTQRQQANGRTQAAQPAATPPAGASPQPAMAAPNPAPAPVTFSEAPSSINLRFDYKGHEGIQLTLRDVSGSQLLQKLDAVLGKLQTMGATPTAERKRPTPGQAQGEANAESATGEAPVCKYHGPMKPSKFGGWHCTKKMGDGTYCNEKHV